MNASGKENARCLDSDSDHISQCTHPQVTSHLVSSNPNSLAYCRQIYRQHKRWQQVVFFKLRLHFHHSFHCDFKSASYLDSLAGRGGRGRGSWMELGLEVEVLSAWDSGLERAGPASDCSPASPLVCFCSAWAMMLATRSLSTWTGTMLLSKDKIE